MQVFEAMLLWVSHQLTSLRELSYFYSSYKRMLHIDTRTVIPFNVKTYSKLEGNHNSNKF